jgi:hypothetical protein
MPQPITELNDAATGSDDPTLSSDMLEIFFNTERPAGAGDDDIWTARRDAVTDPWGAPSAVGGLNTMRHEEGPSLSPDGLTLYFARDLMGNAGFEIMSSTRAASGDPWSPPELVTELNDSSNEWRAQWANDNAVLLSSNRVGSVGSTDVFLATRTSPTDSWMIGDIPGVNSSVTDTDGWMDATLTRLIFASHRSGSRELYLATRATPSDAFDPPQPVAGVNTKLWNGDMWLSPDGCTAYLSLGANDRSLELHVAQR